MARTKKAGRTILKPKSTEESLNVTKKKIKKSRRQKVSEKGSSAEPNQTEHGGGTVEAPNQTSTAEEHKNKGKKRGRAGTEGELSPEELERRRKQSQLREIALKLRAEGKPYKPRKQKHKLFEQENGKPKNQKPNKQQGRDPRGGPKPPKDTPQVIVIPIFWNAKPDEKAQVLEAAKKVLELLSGSDIRAASDESNTLKPGQKFRFWEERGVKVRVEIGPSEAKAGTCVLARCGIPGEVAQKQPMAVGESLLHSITTILAASHTEQTSDKTNEQQKKGGVSALPKGAPQNKEETTTKPAGKAAATAVQDMSPGGDDLEDDFDLEEMDEDQPNKKKKGKKHAGNDTEASGWKTAGRKNASKGKLVKF